MCRPGWLLDVGENTKEKQTYDCYSVCMGEKTGHQKEGDRFIHGHGIKVLLYI